MWIVEKAQELKTSYQTSLPTPKIKKNRDTLQTSIGTQKKPCLQSKLNNYSIRKIFLGLQYSAAKNLVLYCYLIGGLICNDGLGVSRLP